MQAGHLRVAFGFQDFSKHVTWATMPIRKIKHYNVQKAQKRKKRYRFGDLQVSIAFTILVDIVF